jgi:predicted transcriptional regulator
MQVLSCIIERPQTARSLSKLTGIAFSNVFRNLRVLEIYGLIRVGGFERQLNGKRSREYHSAVSSLNIRITGSKVSYIAQYIDGVTEEVVR